MSADEPRSGASESEPRTEGTSDGTMEPRGAAGRPPISGFKKVLIGLSILLMVVGAVGWVMGSLAGSTEPQAPDGGQGSSPLVQGFGPDDGGVAGEPADGSASRPLDDWSPVIFRLGFSFFVGFCIAYAVRTFLKISIVAIGMILLVLFGLQYADVIQVDWDKMGDHFDTFTGWLGTQTSTFKDFITGYLPSAASATAGLVLGFKKR